MKSKFDRSFNAIFHKVDKIKGWVSNRRRLHMCSEENASVPLSQPRQKYHFAPVPVLFCPGYNFSTSLLQ